jgi:two-component system, LytTR family, sensor kinase
MYSTRYRYVIGLVLGVYSFINTLTVEAFTYYGITTNKWLICLLFVLVTVLVWEGNRLIDAQLKVNNSKFSWKRIGLTFAGSAIITAFVSLTLGGLLLYFTMSKDYNTWLLPLKLLLMFAFRINLFLNILNVVFLYQKELDFSREEIQNYKRITSQAQLQSLKNQINPHFLFNNLSVLSELITVDTSASEEFVKQFAKVYRYVLGSHEKELIEIEEELKFIKSYSYLLKTRFMAGLEIHVDVSKDVIQGYILPMALQMLVENAIKHNLISRHSPLVLNIYNDDNGLLWVKNNLQLKKAYEVESTKVGLSNIKKRYEYLGYKDIFVQKSETEFMVAIPIITLPKEHFSNKLEKQFA